MISRALPEPTPQIEEKHAKRTFRRPETTLTFSLKGTL